MADVIQERGRSRPGKIRWTASAILLVPSDCILFHRAQAVLGRQGFGPGPVSRWTIVATGTGSRAAPCLVPQPPQSVFLGVHPWLKLELRLAVVLVSHLARTQKSDSLNARGFIEVV